MKNVRRAAAVIAAVVVVLCCASGCNNKQDEPIYPPEDTEGTTRRTQESVLEEINKVYQSIDCVTFNPDVPACREMFEEFMTLIEETDSGITFNRDTVAASFTGYNVELATPLDAWGHPMRLYVEPEDIITATYILLINSSGANGEEELLGTYDLHSGNDGDDIYSSFIGVVPIYNEA